MLAQRRANAVSALYTEHDRWQHEGRVTADRRDLRTIGANLAARRKIHGLTQQDLAERAGISRATLASLERGDGGPWLEAFLAVARALNLNDALVSATDPLATEYGRVNAGCADRQRVRS